MPTYSYRCTRCDNAFDIHQAFTDDSLTADPACGGPLRKVFSAVGVTFNGSGFYRTDSRSSAPASGASSTPAPASTPSSPPSSTPSSTAPAAAPTAG